MTNKIGPNDLGKHPDVIKSKRMHSPQISISNPSISFPETRTQEPNRNC